MISSFNDRTIVRSGTAIGLLSLILSVSRSGLFKKETIEKITLWQSLLFYYVRIRNRQVCCKRQSFCLSGVPGLKYSTLSTMLSLQWIVESAVSLPREPRSESWTEDWDPHGCKPGTLPLSYPIVSFSSWMALVNLLDLSVPSVHQPTRSFSEPLHVFLIPFFRTVKIASQGSCSIVILLTDPRLCWNFWKEQ